MAKLSNADRDTIINEIKAGLGPLAFAKRIVPDVTQFPAGLFRDVDIGFPFMDALIVTSNGAQLISACYRRSQEGVLKLKFRNRAVVTAIYATATEDSVERS